MPAERPSSLPIHALRRLIDQGQLDPKDLLEDLLARIGEVNPRLHAYLAVDPDALRAQLHEVVRGGRRGRLFGIPITIKDNICVRGVETSCASKILQGFRPPYDATVIQRLKAEGAVIVPRANMDEFAFGSSTENSAFGITRNPWDTERVPGGSSGGSAAAVAGDLAIAALGSDTGGSIRQPAAFCGIVGLKPTYGRVSRYGLVAFASSLDQIGPLTKDVTDAALLLSVIAGHDARDSTSVPTEVPDYLGQLAAPVKGLRIGLPELPAEGVAPEVRAAIDAAVDALKKLGLTTVSVPLPHLQHCVATYYIVATAEASSNLSRYDGVQYGLRVSDGDLLSMYERTRAEGFGVEAKRRIMLGTYVLSHGYYDAYYLKGLKLRTLIKQDFDQAFQRCDVVLTPTSPTAPFKMGEKLADPLQMYLSDIFTISANLAGIPAVSLPCGLAGGTLPIGLQLMAPAFQESRLLGVAHAYEQATDWHRKRSAAMAGAAR
jgi:aspartyl-tRNA(Asn)/glutamyl-tRNA(Gln) amidotransferase subunit A